jgi:hypothetical protein
VGTSHDTGAFAVNALRLWWRREGCLRYPAARRLLVTCDAGGSNGHRCRLWKQQLRDFAEETGLAVTVMHFPPGTSKWNKIEHRLFCHVTRTWSQSPLLTLDDAVAGIAATVTSRGLKVTAVRDDAEYPAGAEVSDREMKDLEDRWIDRGPDHGDLCYTVLPLPRGAPEPEPEPPAGPDPALLAALAALAGVPPPPELHAAVALPWEAARVSRLTLRQRRMPSRGPRYSKLSDEAILVAAACRIRLRMTWTLLGRLLGVDTSTICLQGNWAVPVLEAHGIAPGPPTPRLSTQAQLLTTAENAGIAIPASLQGTVTRDTPETVDL